jgi:hypothetical protein
MAWRTPDVDDLDSRRATERVSTAAPEVVELFGVALASKASAAAFTAAQSMEPSSRRNRESSTLTTVTVAPDGPRPLYPVLPPMLPPRQFRPLRRQQKGAVSSAFLKADARIRTADPFITSVRQSVVGVVQGAFFHPLLGLGGAPFGRRSCPQSCPQATCGLGDAAL